MMSCVGKRWRLLDKRAFDEVERRLAAYTPVETDARIDAELRRLIVSGMTEKRPLPSIPPHIARPPAAAAPARRARRRRRG